MFWNFLNSEKRKDKDFERAINNAFSNLTEAYVGTDRLTHDQTVVALASLNKKIHQHLQALKAENEEKVKDLSEAIEYLEGKSNIK